MEASTVTTVLLVFFGGITIISILAYLLSGRRQGFARFERTHRFSGVRARFGCGDVQRIQLMNGDGITIRRNVHVREAAKRNCHFCWLSTGVDRLDAGRHRDLA